MTQVYRGGQPYGSGLPARLTAHEARIRVFDSRGPGVDPDQVREFQAQVADELAELHRWIRRLGEENGRLRQALRDWQTMHARECRPPDESHR
ncbi:cell division protein DivIVA [Micromonospora sp. NPDC049836]|uniref:cell division protein DivIVA n=1 Tax=unclassified Micromonospora TaxID=2617518 RepID=UPI0033CB8CFE